jgi:hypothetical protein
MVGVRAPRLAPALLKHAPHRVVQHLLRGATGAGVLAHRLLGKDRHDGTKTTRSPHVPQRRQPQAVSKARRRLKAERYGPQPRQALTQRGGVPWRKQAKELFTLPLPSETSGVPHNLEDSPTRCPTRLPCQREHRAANLNLRLWIDL